MQFGSLKLFWLWIKSFPPFVSRQFCPVEAEILVRKADILGPPQAVADISGC